MTSFEELPKAASRLSIAGEAGYRGEWSGARPDSIEALQVIYKIAERCNINCSYCYYFNMGEKTPAGRPAYASLDVTDALAKWIAQGCRELRIPRVRLSFHGGEPMLVGPEAFDKACRRLRDVIEPVAKLALSIQTNGTLVDEQWIEKFIAHRVAIGVSIDGAQGHNDRFRLDRRGHSTFHKTEQAIRCLVEAHDRGASLPSTISVLNHENDYRAIYRYLRGLGVRELSFLLPDRDGDDLAFIASGAGAAYGACLADIFREWLAEDNPRVRIKFIDKMLSHFRPGIAPRDIFERSRKSNQVVIARSDGTIAVDDTYIPALAWYQRTPVYSMTQHTLREFLADPIFSDIEKISTSLPAGCRDCRWREVCRGGDIENRFRQASGFDNPSVYCDAYKVMYQAACDELTANGYPAELIADKFVAA
ncbi:MAG TPA: radical SAM protein [Rhizomicrobium sp.]|nr:radical SAM protein [Rhizomicrobium sp.]